jgi:hypothetical protein
MMTGQRIRLQNVSNPAAFGVEWVSGENGNRFQLVNIRGTRSLMFGMSSDGRPWTTTPVVNPERFGMSEPPKRFAEFLKVATSYVSE